MILRGTMKD